MSLILKSLKFHKTRVENKGKYCPFVKEGILWGGSSSARPLVWRARGALFFIRTSAARMNMMLSPRRK